MASITVGTRTNFNVNAVRVKMEAIAARKAAAACQQIGPLACRTIAAGAPTSKDGRHRSKSLTDAGSYTFDVTRQANGARLNFHIMGDELFKAKFFAINSGSGAHVIPGRPWLSFKRTDDPVGQRIAVRSVNHPGTTGTHFYEHGIEAAIALIPGLLH